MFQSLKNMPKGVTALYFIQAFSTFTFAVLYSSLSLYLTKQLGLSSTVSNSIVALFLAFNFILHLLGGLIGGRYLSNRYLFFITTLLQSLGVLLLAFTETSLLYFGLSLFLVGCGLNVTAYNNMLTQRFKANDQRRDTSFFLSYSAMNVGFCAGFFISGFFDYSNQYQTLFYSSIAGNIITLIFMRASWADFRDIDTPLIGIKDKKIAHKKHLIGTAGILLLIPLLLICLKSSNISNSLVTAVSIIMFFVILYLGFKQESVLDKQRVMTFLILAVTSILFWMIYYTGPMGITLFIKNNVDRHIFNYEVATQWILNINSIVIIIGAPLLSMLLNNLQQKGFKTPVTTQFVWAFMLLGCSFYLLSSAIISANGYGYSSIYWVILYFIIQSFAELLIGPVGYAMIGRISPPQLQGVLMGTWMMVSGVSASLSHYFSNAMMKTQETNPFLTNGDYLHVFNQLGTWAVLGAVFLYLVARKMKPILETDKKAEAIEVINAA